MIAMRGVALRLAKMGSRVPSDECGEQRMPGDMIAITPNREPQLRGAGFIRMVPEDGEEPLDVFFEIREQVRPASDLIHSS